MNHKIADGTFSTDVANREWRTVLLGGQRGGGPSLYLLDVTDPSAFTEANAKALVEWEFTHPELGYTFSKPTIAMMNNGKFAAIFGNGYSAEGAGSCTAKLFIVFLEGGLDGVWTSGTDYLILDTGSGSTTTGDCNGLSTPAVVDLDRDRDADRVYAGDLKGNLWAFDLCNYSNGTKACTATGWAVANVEPIMTADDGTTSQPITTQPVVSLDPASTGAADLLIVFGTGQYLTEADKTTTQVQTMYGVRDYDALKNGRANADWGLDPRDGGFIVQTLTEEACTATGCAGDVRTITNVAIGDFSTHKGWYIDLNPTGAPAGERVVVNPKIRNDTLFFNTLIPDITVL